MGLEAGQVIPPCRMEHDVVFVVLEGRGVILVDGEEGTVGKSAFIFVPKEKETRSAHHLDDRLCSRPPADRSDFPDYRPGGRLHGGCPGRSRRFDRPHPGFHRLPPGWFSPQGGRECQRRRRLCHDAGHGRYCYFAPRGEMLREKVCLLEKLPQLSYRSDNCSHHGSYAAMRKASKALFLLIGLLVAHLLLAFLYPLRAREILLTSTTYLLEMLSILPPILILVGLFEVWVPKSIITRLLGIASGWKGGAVAVLTGTAGGGRFC